MIKMELLKIEDRQLAQEVTSGEILIKLDQLQIKGLYAINDELLGAETSFHNTGYKNKGDYLAIHSTHNLEDGVMAKGYVVSEHGSVYLIGEDSEENEYVYKVWFN